MDKAPLRRGMETVHTKYGESTALLAGDVMLVKAYDYLSEINKDHLSAVLRLFNTTAREVCEGQQMDMDYESNGTSKAGGIYKDDRAEDFCAAGCQPANRSHTGRRQREQIQRHFV